VKAKTRRQKGLNASNAPYKNLTLVIDTREKNPDRIGTIKEFFFNMGGTIKMSTVLHCDYYVYGGYMGKPVDLGIEYKELPDLCGTWKELHERFAKTCTVYDNVALFIEGKIKIVSHPETNQTFIANPSTWDDMGELLPYVAYHHGIHEYERMGIIVNQYDNMDMFSYTLDCLLKYLVNYPFTGIRLTKENPYRMNYSMYAQINGLGSKSLELLAPESIGYWLANQAELLKVLKPAKFKKFLAAMDPKGYHQK
jgi:hypothetical protein